MDKYEYKIRAEEIKSLIEERRYPEAMAIADTIDWRKVKSVSMLCDISDLYNVNRKFEVARDVLELAYARHPEGRRIVYSLCELSIKMGDVVQAVEYYKEFVRIAGRDTGRYILQYKIYEAQDVSIEERIAILEELKKRDYREKWAYELAFLYHRAGLATQCVEECDDLILWFGEGTYVKKALELKMLHEALTPAQRDKYNMMTGGTAGFGNEPEIRVKTVDTSPYNTLNLQRELAQNLEQVLADELGQAEDVVAVHTQHTGVVPPIQQEIFDLSEEQPQGNVLDMISGNTGDYPNYGMMEQVMQEDPYAQMQDLGQGYEEPVTEEYPAQEQYYEQNQVASEEQYDTQEQNLVQEQYNDQQQQIYQEAYEIPTDETRIFKPEDRMLINQATQAVQEVPKKADLSTPKMVQDGVEVPTGFEELLSQEYDGQISLVVPEEENVDTQITGQLSIEDVLAEWERMKRENEQKRQEEVRKRVLEHTGNLIKEFEQENTQEVSTEALSEDEEEEFEELEEIRETSLEEDDMDPVSLEEEEKNPSLEGAGILAAGLLGGVATAAAGMKIAQAVKNVADQTKTGAQVAEEVIDLEAEAATETISSIEKEDAIPAARVPYGANPYEDMYNEMEAQDKNEQETPKSRIVQDYNELLYGEESEEQPVDWNQDIEETNLEDDQSEEVLEEYTGYEEAQQGEEEEFFDPNAYVENTFEMEEQESEEAQREEIFQEELDAEAFDPNEVYGEFGEEGMDEQEFTAYESEEADSTEFEGAEFGAFDPMDYVEEPEALELEENEILADESVYEEEAVPVAAIEEDSAESEYEGEEVYYEPEDQAVGEESYEDSVEKEDVEQQSEQFDNSAFTIEDDDFMDRALKEQLGASAAVPYQGVSHAEQMPSSPQMMEDLSEDVFEESEQEEMTADSFYERQLAMDEVVRNTRDFTPQEEELYGNFLRTKKAKDQLVYAIDNVSMASYTGNIIITGDNQDENMELAKSLTKEVQMNDSNFSGTLAKISANSLNHKDVDSILRKVEGGAVIIYGAGALTRETVNGIISSIEQENRGIIIILIDIKMNIDKLLSMNPVLRTNFNARIDIEEMTTAELQTYGKSYAYEREYAIDEMGMLELYARIEQLQTIGHTVTPEEVEDIIENAIKKANKANLKHYTDILFNKRYDIEDMIILKARDFL